MNITVHSTAGAEHEGLDVTTASTPPGPFVVRVEGDLDHETSTQLRTVLSDLLRPPPGDEAEVIVDLRETGFVDSTGLGVLVFGCKLSRADGRGYAVVATSDQLIRMFRITGLDEIMPLHPDVPAAVSWMSGDVRN